MKPSDYIEIFLQPGEFYFGDRDTRVRTLLGSCVAITMWHPTRLLGGMCHCLLPSTNSRAGTELDGRFIEDALLMFLKSAVDLDSDPAAYELKVFGGGNMFPELKKVGDDPIGERNAATVRRLLTTLGLKIKAEHLGGIGHRTIIFDIWNGLVYMKHSPVSQDLRDLTARTA